MSSTCPECGIIGKFGEASCCGRGGSWFGNCGSAGNANLDHTWYEGIRACKRRFRAVVGQQVYFFQPLRDAYLDDINMGMDSKAVVVAAHTFESAPGIAATPTSFATPIIMTVNTPIISSVYTSTAHDTGTASYKPIARTPNAIAHNIMNALTPQVSTTSVSMMFTPQPATTAVNMTIIPLATTTTVELMSGVSTEMSMTSASLMAEMPMTSASLTAMGVSIAAREYTELLHILTHINIILVTVC